MAPPGTSRCCAVLPHRPAGSPDAGLRPRAAAAVPAGTARVRPQARLRADHGALRPLRRHLPAQPRHRLPAAGRAELAERRGDLAALEENLAESVRALAAQVRDEVRGAMAGLRADLAAAAQEARASALPPPATHDRRAASRLRRAEAEALLQQFRDEVRADLRRADALRDVPPLTVDTIRTVLSSACTAIRATLNGPGR